MKIHHHLQRHGQFYVAAALGLLVWVLARALALSLPVSLAGDTFFATYLLLTVRKVRQVTPSDIRKSAAAEDEGIALIFLLTVVAIALSMGSIFLVLNTPGSSSGVYLALSLAGVPLGWITLHTIMAFRYAHLFYAKHPGRKAGDAGGLAFPSTSEPGSWDFLYYSFVIGMTAQVSDVQVLSSDMRKVTLWHGVVSFFFNTVIVALAVNVALSAVR